MNTLPHRSGIGLKAQHYAQLIENTDATGWLEIHPENYMGKGGPPHRYLEKLRQDYALSMHGVGMSLGSVDGIDESHLERLKTLVDRYKPEQVSEHLSWSHWNSIFLNDLLPLPYTGESLDVVCTNIDKVQTKLRRSILIENPSTYVDFDTNEFSETDFFKAIVKRTGCGILLDINNVFVSAFNNHFDAVDYLNEFPSQYVGEIHLAGHSLKNLTENEYIRIDDHGSEVKDEVWDLYTHFLEKRKIALPTLIEWDTDVPELEILLAQSNKANAILDSFTGQAS